MTNVTSVTSKWLIFDAMGVVYEKCDDTRDLLIPYIKRKSPGINEQDIYDLYIKASLGAIPSKEFWQISGFEDWQWTEKDYLDNFITLDSQFIKAAELLSKEFNIAMLSNDVSEWSSYLRKKHRLDKFFKAIVISGDVGYRKPDKKIYEILLQRINASAADCIFFDDRVKNLIPAYELGIRPIHFNRDRVDSEGFASVNGFGEICCLLEDGS